MKTKELVDAIATELDKPKTEVKAVFDAATKLLLASISKKEETEVLGLGKITVSFKEAGEARNPQTGAIAPTAAKYVPKFKLGKAAKDAANV